MGSCDGPPFASLSCLHQGAKKSTVVERLLLRKQKAFGKGWTCIISLLGTPQEEFVPVLGCLPMCPGPVKDCGLPCLLQTVGILIWGTETT